MTKFCVWVMIMREKKIVNFVSVHGIGFNFDEENTFGPWLSERLKRYGKLTNCHFPLGDQMTFKNWELELDKHKQELNQNTTVVAHSLGALFILIYLKKNNLKIGSLISIGAGYNTAYSNHPIYKDFVPSASDFEYCKNNITNRFMIYSDNDRFFTEEHQQSYIKNLDAQPVYVKGQGHFGRSDGVAEIPAAVDVLKAIINQ